MSLEMIHIGLPRSITLAEDPQRDRDLDAVCEMIENAAAAGLRGLNYNFCILNHQRRRAPPDAEAPVTAHSISPNTTTNAVGSG